MKVIFLDIDGVLNSVRYDRERTPENDNNIDETRLPLLKQVVDQTGARIVLSSSWRRHWNREDCLCDEAGRKINDSFRRYGLEIMDKTPRNSARDRAKEIYAWLESCEDQVEAFVIIDDMLGGWGDLADHLVKTSAYVGRGLEEEHVRLAVKKLNEIE